MELWQHVWDKCLDNKLHQRKAKLIIIIINNDNEILIKREPLVYTRARRAVQRKKKEREKEKG